MANLAESIAAAVRMILAIFYEMIFAILYAASLYLFATTASIAEAYQAGIHAATAKLDPLLLILVAAGLPLVLGSIWRAQRASLAGFVQRMSLVAGVLTFLVCVLLVVIDSARPHCLVSPPLQRELDSTLLYALLCPHFSNRSGAAPLYSGVLSMIMLGSASLVRRRASAVVRRK